MTEREIFFEALEMTTPEARAAYLQGACGHDVTLRQKVHELLKEHFSNDSLLAGSALEVERPGIAEFRVEVAPAQMIGRYKLLEKIGEGGFGEVWMAEQREPVKRRVALKIIKPGMDSRQIVARFEAERQALAMINHANIARIFDAGVTVKVWDPFGADPPTGLPNQMKAVWFSPDARQLITATNFGGGQLILWDTTTRQNLGAPIPTTDGQRYVLETVSDDGQLAALATADGVIDVWNLQARVRGVRIEAGVDASTHRLAFSPDGAWLAAAPAMLHHSTSAGGLHLWNLESHTHAPRFFPHAFAPLAFCTDGRRLVFVQKDGIVQVSDFHSGVLLAQWKAHAAPIHSLALSPDNRLMATGAEDATVRVWDMASHEKLLELKGHLTGIPVMAFAPDGRTLVTVTWENTIKFWHIATGRELFTIDQFRMGVSTVYSARFSPNGEYLAVSGDDGRGQRQLMLWRAPSWEEIAAAERAEKTAAHARSQAR